MLSKSFFLQVRRRTLQTCMHLCSGHLTEIDTLRTSPVCGQVSSIIISLCCPKNLTVVLQRSVRFLEKWLFITHWVESSPSGDAMYSHPSSPPCFPVVPCFNTTVLLLFISGMMGFRVDAVSLWCPAVPMLAIHKGISSCFRAVASGTVDCAFVGSDTWLHCSWHLMSLRTKPCQGGGANVATVRLSSQLGLTISQ